MKKIGIVMLACIAPFISNGQNYNPFVSQGIVSPSPMYDVASHGTGELSFIVGNTGDDPIPLVKGQEMLLNIALSNGIPNNPKVLAALSGSYVDHFNWAYDAEKKTYKGIQNQAIPGAMEGGVGNITIQYKVSANSVGVGPQNGFKATIITPSFITDKNTFNDDEVSSYTWTLLKLKANNDFEITKVNELLTGDVSANDKIEPGTMYSNPVAGEANPSTCLPEFEATGKFSFACPKAGKYSFAVNICEPHPSTYCTTVPLVITVLEEERK